MSRAWSIRAADEHDADVLATLRTALWPDADRAEHLLEVRRSFEESARSCTFLAIDSTRTVVGFAEAAVRVDPVNGTDASPVGFLEGLYILPAWRRHGVGRALVNAVEQWTRARGCFELASDALLDNRDSHAAHAAYGFEETERVVYFRKRLD
ncbi:MAG: aminoglycoside 6'-N-acetyltransferase [Dokdonella sp.]